MASRLSETARCVTVAHAGWAEQDHVGGARHEGERGQLADLALVDRGLKGEVALGKRLVKRQVRKPRLGLEVPLSAGLKLRIEQVGEEVDVGHLLGCGRLQATLQHCGRLLQAKGRQLVPRALQRNHPATSRRA